MPIYHEDDEYEDEYDDELLPLPKRTGTGPTGKRPALRSIDRRALDAAQHKDPGSRPQRVRPYLSPEEAASYHSRHYGAVPRTIHRTPYPEPRYPTSPGRSISAIIGGVLLILAIVGFAWFWNYKQAPSVLPAWTQSHIPTIGRAPAQLASTSTIEQVPALVAAGITLQHPAEAPALNQQQALLIASQLEPEAAANAHSTTSQFVLLDYTNRSNASAQPALNHVPAWMILYQGIPLQPNDASADPKPNPQTSHNLYVFLNATTGKELLAIWV